MCLRQVPAQMNLPLLRATPTPTPPPPACSFPVNAISGGILDHMRNPKALPCPQPYWSRHPPSTAISKCQATGSRHDHRKRLKLLALQLWTLQWSAGVSLAPAPGSSQDRMTERQQTMAIPHCLLCYHQKGNKTGWAQVNIPLQKVPEGTFTINHKLQPIENMQSSQLPHPYPRAPAVQPTVSGTWRLCTQPPPLSFA